MCETHELLEKNVDRMKSDLSQLYDLDRQKLETMNNLQQQVTKQGTKIETMQNQINEMQKVIKEISKSTNELAQSTKDLKNITTLLQSDMKEVKAIMKEKKWQPKDIALIVVACISFLSAVSVALIGLMK